MADNKINLTEQQISDKVFESIYDCDPEVMAQIAGLMFGGACQLIDDHYEFIPNENYFEAFGELEYTITSGSMTIFKGTFTEAEKQFVDISSHQDIVDACKRMQYSLFFKVKDSI